MLYNSGLYALIATFALARPKGPMSSVTLLAMQEGAPTLMSALAGLATDNVA